MKAAMKEQLEEIVKYVNLDMIDPDIEIDYCIPEVETTASSCDVEDPYILVTYVVGEHNSPTRKIKLRETYLKNNTAKEIADQVTASISEFKGEIDSVQMG